MKPLLAEQAYNYTKEPPERWLIIDHRSTVNQYLGRLSLNEEWLRVRIISGRDDISSQMEWVSKHFTVLGAAPDDWSIKWLEDQQWVREAWWAKQNEKVAKKNAVYNSVDVKVNGPNAVPDGE